MPLVTLEELTPKIYKITLSNADSRNAMCEDMAREFSGLISDLKIKKEKPRVIILTGAGKAFSAGGNLEMLRAKAQKTKEQNEREMMTFYKSFLSIRELGVPLIAAVNGHAVGAGLCLACACDIRVVSCEAKLGFTFTKLGLYPGMGATFFLPRLIGEDKAAELMLTSKIIVGKQVFDYGVTAHLVKKEQVIATSLEIAQEIIGCGELATNQLLITTRGSQDLLVQKLNEEARNQAESYASKQFLDAVS